MPTYQREVRVRAPFETVWAFHSRPEGLEALTPDWMHLRVEEVRHPDGAADSHGATDPHGPTNPDSATDSNEAADPDVLEAGTIVRSSVRPFGVGPRQHWTSRIVRREEGDGSAVFEDEMLDGPFPEWRHRHQFYAISDSEAQCASNASGERSDPRADETLVRDRVTYELPVVGGLLGPLGWLGFEPMFRERHRRTKKILEDGGDANNASHAGIEGSRAENQRSE